ncbi:glycosyltransferase family 4 protein [Tautonia plasticadhaerens]|uniref:Alpha-D-kanosaminyltransferase n=1 Tax=Tautonia plasticadhaerens TaxID=2527974 RepID=A0A518GZ08_9BACT|nr:glycosyltransferase family 4 protein [Tautonia plasticadhaerens]QDV33825.1 Alpha-D-kanosaminyltransferase [Tautonia plasticadhaerens]
MIAPLASGMDDSTIRDDLVTHLALHSPPERGPAGPEPGPMALVACPDARPPAYQAAIGLAGRAQLDTFLTGFYDRGDGPFRRVASRVLDQGRRSRLERALGRRHHPDLPGDRVRSTLAFDLALAAEKRLSGKSRRSVSRWRTEHFDRTLEARIRREPPGVAFVFSDVGSGHALPLCRSWGIPTVLSMVHGDVREERRILDEEAERCPEAFGLYLGDATLDRAELDYLHGRRLRDLEYADLVLVPSGHIAGELRKNGFPGDRIRVVPYASDVRRFRPDPAKVHGSGCTFLFAGGISQRKGIAYLLRAWQSVRRPGWRLQLLGEPPRAFGPLAPLLVGVEVLGRVPHGEVPAAMARADVFVFPSLFEGSAVVTYEALSCGLPGVVTPSSGSVARDGLDGIVVPPADVAALAGAMERLGSDPELRAFCSRNARSQAERFDWPRYHRAVVEAVGAVAPR